jgi:hypothetical protein
LKRKRSVKFLGDRFQRLGVPFLIGVVVVMPLALYPAYRVTASDPSVAAYIRHYLALPFLPNGPLWFLWLLLALTVLATALFRFVPHWVEFLARRPASAAARPGRYFIGLALAAALAYVPLALLFTPWRWADGGLFAFQYSRPLFYAVFYVAGLAIGANGLDHGLLATDGHLARHWNYWLAGALASLVAWMGLTKLALDFAGAAPVALQIAVGIGFAVACTSSCFFVLGGALRFGAIRSRLFDNFAENAFSLYLFHYMFVVWLQYALLGLAVFALAKGAMVFAGTLALSWALTAAVRALPFGSHLIGAPRRLASATAERSGGAIGARYDDNGRPAPKATR